MTSEQRKVQEKRDDVPLGEGKRVAKSAGEKEGLGTAGEEGAVEGIEGEKGYERYEGKEDRKLDLEEYEQDQLERTVKQAEDSARVLVGIATDVRELGLHQKRGHWETNEAREEVAEIKQRLRERGVDPGDNLTYNAEKHKISIEDTDENVLKEKRKRTKKNAVKNMKALPDRPQEEVVVDDDPNLVDILLDHPSHADRKIAELKGQEQVFEYLHEEELEEFEKGEGRVPEKKLRKDESDLTKRTKRGPAITTNEFGAEQLRVLYEKKAEDESEDELPFNDPMDQLQYFPIYPGKVKKWITYLRQPKGRFDEEGFWENDPELHYEEQEKRQEFRAKGRQLPVDEQVGKSLPPDLVGMKLMSTGIETLVGCDKSYYQIGSYCYPFTFHRGSGFFSI